MECEKGYEYCQTNIEYAKKVIQRHEENTSTHLEQGEAYNA
jgi:hypothetical protein